MPVCYPQCAGKAYRPSNGTEGEMFMERFCCRCQHDEDEENPCEILTMTFAVGVDDPEYPKEWVYDRKGHPTCTMFALPGTEPTHRRCDATLDLFES